MSPTVSLMAEEMAPEQELDSLHSRAAVLAVDIDRLADSLADDHRLLPDG